LAHTIEAISGNDIKRVKCNTCQGTHQFRPNAPGVSSTKSKVKVKSLAASKTKSKSSDFKNLLEGKDLTKALVYNWKYHFSKGDLVNHTSFGLGIVVEEKDVHKIEVLFEEGARLLVHART
jgi:hypothetical protein